MELQQYESRPQVSVVIPAYNAAGMIEMAVESVLRQTVADIEVVVCNDASTDHTLQILQSIKDPRLVVLSNTVNEGEGVARNRAIAAARGEWVAVLDADDVWDERRLENMLAATNNETDVMVFDDLLICHHTSAGLVPWRKMRGSKAFNGNGKAPVDVAAESWAGSYQFLIKPLIHTNTLHESGVQHSTLKFGADTEFFLRLIAKGMRLRYVPGAYYWYRITPNSASANAKRMDLMNGMLESLLPLLERQPALQEAIRNRIRYRTLLQHLKAGRILDAGKIFWQDPRIFSEFIHRAVRQMLYLSHRRINSGLSR